MAQSGYETARVDIEEGLGLLVGIDFDVLVRDLLVFEGDPDALDEGTGSGVSSGVTSWIGWRRSLECWSGKDYEKRDNYQNALP